MAQAGENHKTIQCQCSNIAQLTCLIKQVLHYALTCNKLECNESRFLSNELLKVGKVAGKCIFIGALPHLYNVVYPLRVFPSRLPHHLHPS